MQHKQALSKPVIFIILIAIVLMGGLIHLMTANIPAQQKPVEKELDAKAFFPPKQQ